MKLPNYVHKRIQLRLIVAAVALAFVAILHFSDRPPALWERSPQAQKIDAKPVALRMRAAFYSLENQKISSLQCHLGNPFASAIKSALHTKIFSETEAESLSKYGADLKVLRFKDGGYSSSLNFPKLNWQGGSSEKAESLAGELITSYQGTVRLLKTILDQSYSRGPYPFIFSNIDLWLSGKFYEAVTGEMTYQISSDLTHSELRDKDGQQRFILHYAPIVEPGLLAVKSFEVYVEHEGKKENIRGQLTYVPAEKNLYYPEKLTITKGPHFWASLTGDEITIPIENCQSAK